MSTTQATSVIQILGAFGFGTLLGWYIYYINRHRTEEVKLADLATLVGVIGGGAVLALFPASTDLFGSYGIGLAVGFFGYFVTLIFFVRRSSAFDSNWFLDGRCKKPASDEQIVTPVPMEASNRRDTETPQPKHEPMEN